MALVWRPGGALSPRPDGTSGVSPSGPIPRPSAEIRHSGGQEQRVAIARAIVTDPTLLVADEPTGDLDAKSAEEILDLIKRLNEEFHKTIIMVTHDPRAASHAHAVLHLEKGVLSRSGGVYEVPAAHN